MILDTGHPPTALIGVSEARSMRAVGRAYAELAEIASQLAKAVEWEGRASEVLPRTATKRRRSA